MLTTYNNLEDLQQIHLANGANSHQLEILLLEMQQAGEGRLCKALQHGLCGRIL